MECQDEMVEMESQGDEGRGETLVCRDHLAGQVCMHFRFSVPILSSDYFTITSTSIMNMSFIGLHQHGE